MSHLPEDTHFVSLSCNAGWLQRQATLHSGEREGAGPLWSPVTASPPHPQTRGPTHMTLIEVIAGRVHDHNDLQPFITVPPPGVGRLPAPLHAGGDVDVHTGGPVDLERLCALRY